MIRGPVLIVERPMAAREGVVPSQPSPTHMVVVVGTAKSRAPQTCQSGNGPSRPYLAADRVRTLIDLHPPAVVEKQGRSTTPERGVGAGPSTFQPGELERVVSSSSGFGTTKVVPPVQCPSVAAPVVEFAPAADLGHAFARCDRSSVAGVEARTGLGGFGACSIVIQQPAQESPS